MNEVITFNDASSVWHWLMLDTRVFCNKHVQQKLLHATSSNSMSSVPRSQSVSIQNVESDRSQPTF